MVDFGLCDPADEDGRQRAVNRSGVLQGKSGRELQAIVDRAAVTFRVPLATISIIDRDRQWFAARCGIEETETARSISFCAQAIRKPGEPLVVPDARNDPRFRDYPNVRATPGIRFYVGMPLIDRMGYALGALCIADFSPRPRPRNLVDLQFLAHEAERALAA